MGLLLRGREWKGRGRGGEGKGEGNGRVKGKGKGRKDDLCFTLLLGPVRKSVSRDKDIV